MQVNLEPALFWEENSVRVWISPLNQSPEVLHTLRQTLSVGEHERAARYRLPQMADAFIVRRGMLRVLLGKELGCLPSSLHFDYNPFGKPILASRALSFSVSSSRDYSVWAFSSALPIGVDIEWINPEMPRTALMEDYFSSTERKYLNEMKGEAERTDAFFRTWTGKEACAKAAGTGFAAPLNRYAILEAHETTIETTQGPFTVKSRAFLPKPAKVSYWMSFGLAPLKT